MTDKRPQPVTSCTKCGAVGYDIQLANGPCGRFVDRSMKCKGVNGSAINEGDWEECPSCGGTGDWANLHCDQCQGAGWLFVRGGRRR